MWWRISWSVSDVAYRKDVMDEMVDEVVVDRLVNMVVAKGVVDVKNVKAEAKGAILVGDVVEKQLVSQ